MVYSDAQEKISYKYTSLTNGVKEEIILEEKPDTNIFEFKLNLPGMKIKANDYCKELRIFDKKTKKMVAYICEPNIKDADGKVTC